MTIIDDIKNSIANALSSFIDMMKDLAQAIIDAMIKAIKAPFEYLQSAFYSSYYWLSDNAGPFAPIIYMLIVFVTVVIGIKLFKRMKNMILS